eukprot:TRINITY_DN1386_c1_g3_i1.p2 TRINITY_DN1386_c1_g3~~TRINITY_DN1386_c1_g3_i1.p2  ORF type:complete len:464 (-),score=74.24 TRINITY_DN1386_c1_g3_i1:2494-3741(-)
MADLLTCVATPRASFTGVNASYLQFLSHDEDPAVGYDSSWLERELGETLIVTGHSLGGARALIWYIRKFGRCTEEARSRTFVVTFGAPVSIFDDHSEVSALLSSQFYHFLHVRDPIPSIPSKTVSGVDEPGNIICACDDRIRQFARDSRMGVSSYYEVSWPFHRFEAYLKMFESFVSPDPWWFSALGGLEQVKVPCLECNGNAAVVVKTLSPLRVADFSISMWLYPRSWNQDYCGLVCSDPYLVSIHGCGRAYVKGTVQRPPSMNEHVSFYVVPDGRSRLASDPEIFVPVPPARKWHFLCVSFRGNHLRVCLDGNTRAVAWPHPAPTFSATVSTLVLGSVFPGPKPGHHFDGYISSVSAFSPALHDTHVNQLLRQGPSFALSKSNLVGHWPLQMDCNRSDGAPPIRTSSVCMGSV